MARPKEALPPPRDLHKRDLPIEVIAAGSTLVRIHRIGVSALHFGTSGDNRFDDPQRRYGVCYTARTLDGAFAETCLRLVGARLVARSFLAERSAARIEVKQDLRLVALHGPGLARVGTTSLLSAGDHQMSQLWSRALYQHPSAPQGLLYRSNHDNAQFCVALFDRARDRLVEASSTRLLSDPVELARVLATYQVGLG